MICYIVVATGLTAEDLSPHFSHVYHIQTGSWVVASRMQTCTDVAGVLGMNSQGGTTGIVVKLGDYYGFYDKALWEKIEAWRLES